MLKHFQPVAVPSILICKQSKEVLYTIIPATRLPLGIAEICAFVNLFGTKPLVLASKAVQAPFLTIGQLVASSLFLAALPKDVIPCIVGNAVPDVTAGL